MNVSTTSAMPDADLVRQAQQGAAEAIHALYARHSRHVYAVCRSVAGDDTLAEDWAQETWLRALRALSGFRGEAQFATWLHRIARNTSLQNRQTRERGTKREVPLDEVVATCTPPVNPVLQLQIETAVRQLPEGMRRVLVLYDVEGYTHQEIGALLGIEPSTSKSQLFKARRKVRQALGGVRPGQGCDRFAA